MILKDSEKHNAGDMEWARTELPCNNLSERFKFGQKDFGKQFSHIYTARLEKQRPALIKASQSKCGNLPLRTLSDLAIEGEEKSIVVGTLFKYQPLKPNILKEISEEHQLVPQPPATHYTSGDDALVLEDETQRIRLKGNLPVKGLVTGIVMAVVGHQGENGWFEVDQCVFATPLAPSKTLDPLPNDCFIALVSGLDFSTNCDLLSAQILADWLTGISGGEPDQSQAALVVQLILAGGLVGVNKDSEDYSEIIEGAKLVDKFCYQLAQSIPLDVMPGETDPTNHSLPQQPLMPSILAQASRMRSCRTVSNPYECCVAGRRVLGTSGQPIDDLLRVTDDLDSLELLKATLEWGHLAPTAPDTLSCYPYYSEDPFTISEQPDIYFAGNQPSYQTSVFNPNGDRQCRLLSLPKFSKTGTIVLVNLRTLDCTPMTFSHPSCPAR